MNHFWIHGIVQGLVDYLARSSSSPMCILLLTEVTKAHAHAQAQLQSVSQSQTLTMSINSPSSGVTVKKAKRDNAEHSHMHGSVKTFPAIQALSNHHVCSTGSFQISFSELILSHTGYGISATEICKKRCFLKFQMLIGWLLKISDKCLYNYGPDDWNIALLNLQPKVQAYYFDSFWSRFTPCHCNATAWLNKVFTIPPGGREIYQYPGIFPMPAFSESDCSLELIAARLLPSPFQASMFQVLLPGRPCDKELSIDSIENAFAYMRYTSVHYPNQLDRNFYGDITLKFKEDFVPELGFW